MSNLVIVAIPKQDDYVWKISSEKVPHLTLLNLGENFQNFPVAKVAAYLQHVAKTTMHRFGMSVDRRDTLGPNNADVLIFEKDWNRMLDDARSFLLKNDDIRTAYDSTAQFPEWIPHLTLGFPETPAKPDNREFPGISWVSFDRVALWTGDSEGPEFRLDEDSSWETRMSDLGMEALAHFGVRGMRWGVRRSAKQLHSGDSDAHPDHTNAANAQAKAKKGGTKALSNKELQDLITRMNLEKQYVAVVPQPKSRRILRSGAKFTGDILLSVGKSQIIKLATDQSGKLVASAFKKK